MQPHFHHPYGIVAARGGPPMSWAVGGRQAPGTVCLAEDLEALPPPTPYHLMIGVGGTSLENALAWA